MIPAARGTVLVVDDGEQIRNLLRLYLERGGHRVTEAADGHDALEICRRSREVTHTATMLLTARGGEVGAESSDGRTRVWFRLPADA